MFPMMNDARLLPGIQAVERSEIAFQNASTYAAERSQASAPDGGRVLLRQAALLVDDVQYSTNEKPRVETDELVPREWVQRGTAHPAAVGSIPIVGHFVIAGLLARAASSSPIDPDNPWRRPKDGAAWFCFCHMLPEVDPQIQSCLTPMPDLEGFPATDIRRKRA